MVDNLRAAFNTGKTRPKQYRLQQLKSLLHMLEDKEDEIATAVYNDLRKVSVCLRTTAVELAHTNG